MKPRLACTNCRLRKKRCDKGYPICSYCLSTHVRCVYQRQDNAATASNGCKVTAVIEEVIATLNTPASSSAALFLDHTLWQKVRHKITRRDIVLPSDLKLQCESISIPDLLTIYNVTLGVWLPFLSSQALSNRLLSPVSRLLGTDLMTILCLDLFTRSPEPGDARTEQYLQIKSIFLSAEIDGVQSIELLQTLIIVLLYEFSHGIYPAAYSTLGACTRLMALLGCDKCSDDESRDWYQIEEGLRIWWAIYVLERCMAIGCPQRRLYLHEPDENTPLPCDDMPWELKERSSQPNLTISSQVMFSMGKFRLLAHASFLLSKAIRHVSGANRDDAAQLERTIFALLKLLEVTDEGGIVSVGGSRAILHSALFLLASSKETHIVEVSSDIRQYSAEYFLTRSVEFCNGNLGSINMATPFLLPWGYESYKYFLGKLNMDGRTDSVEAVKVIGQVLNILNQRWRLAGLYTSLLSLHQELS